MRRAHLNDMYRGWFVGDFQPTVLGTQACEVAAKRYLAGDKESLHHHKVATEVTLVLHGRVRMAGQELSEGDILLLEPGEATDFEALTDAVTIVVKTPGSPNDKYPGKASSC